MSDFSREDKKIVDDLIDDWNWEELAVFASSRSVKDLEEILDLVHHHGMSVEDG